MAACSAGWYTPRNSGVDGAVPVLLVKDTSDKPYDLTCEICGCAMIEQKCKIRCLNCGFTRDCSDP